MDKHYTNYKGCEECRKRRADASPSEALLLNVHELRVKAEEGFANIIIKWLDFAQQDPQPITMAENIEQGQKAIHRYQNEPKYNAEVKTIVSLLMRELETVLGV